MAVALLREVNAGKKSSELVAKFTAAPYGWPKDAIDATLATLLGTNHLIARVNGTPLSLADLDQRKAGQTDYRIQHPVLNAAQKLKVKKLFQDAGNKFTPGDQMAAAAGFVDLLKQLMEGAGDEAPAPLRTHSALVTDIRGLSGNDLLHSLFTNAEELTALVKEWKGAAKRIQDRLPGFSLTRVLWTRASDAGLPAAAEQKAALDAVVSGRQLLMDPDPVAPMRTALANALREVPRWGGCGCGGAFGFHCDAMGCQSEAPLGRVLVATVDRALDAFRRTEGAFHSPVHGIAVGNLPPQKSSPARAYEPPH